MTKESTCPSEFALERLRFGELTGSPEEGQLTAHLAGCPTCRQRRDILAQAESPILDTSAIWARGTARRGEAAQPSRSWFRPRWAIGSLLGASAVAAVALLVPRPATDITTKGSAAKLGVIAKRLDGTTTRIESGARLSPGDRLRFEVFSRLPRVSIAIVMVDSTGAVTRLAPRQGTSLSIAGGQRILLDEAVELDGALGPEEIVLVACGHALDTNDLLQTTRQALAKADGDPRRLDHLGTNCDEETFSITKVKP